MTKLFEEYGTTELSTVAQEVDALSEAYAAEEISKEEYLELIEEVKRTIEIEHMSRDSVLCSNLIKSIDLIASVL